MRFGPRGDGLDHIYFHDIELYSINRERHGDGGHDFTINLFNFGLHWANFTNLLFEDNGGWFARGAGPGVASSSCSSTAQLVHPSIFCLRAGDGWARRRTVSQSPRPR